MNGQQVERILNSNVKILFLIILGLIYSCKRGLNCENEKELFQAEWQEEVSKVYKDKNYRTVFVIETKSGKRLAFQPIQPVIDLSSPGDSLIKKANSFHVEIRTTDRDTFISRVSSVTCDTVVMRELGFKKDRYANIVKIKKKNPKQ